MKKNLLLLSVFAVLYACAGSNKPVDLSVTECFYPDAPTVKAPLWVCGAPVQVNGQVIKYTAVGSAANSKAGVNFTVQQATANARLALAQQLDATIIASVKDSVTATGTQDNEAVDKIASVISNQTTNQNLVGSKVLAQSVSPNKYMYIIVGLNTQDYKQALDDLFEVLKQENLLPAKQLEGIKDTVADKK